MRAPTPLLSSLSLRRRPQEHLWQAVLGGGAQHGDVGEGCHPQMRPAAVPPRAGAGPQRRADVVRELPPRRERQPGGPVPGEEGGRLGGQRYALHLRDLPVSRGGTGQELPPQ